MSADLTLLRTSRTLVDAQPVRDHVALLRAEKLGVRTIADRAGVSTGALQRLLYGNRFHGTGPSQRIRANTAAAILAVQPDSLLAPDTTPVPAYRAHRRLQALVANGWPQRWLSHLLGHKDVYVWTLLQHRYITVSTLRDVIALYDRLGDTPPEPGCKAEAVAIGRAQKLAALRGWVCSLAWDTDQLDRPDGRPFTEPTLARSHRANTADPDEFDFLVSQGESPWQAAKAVGASLETIERARQRRAAA